MTRQLSLLALVLAWLTLLGSVASTTPQHAEPQLVTVAHNVYVDEVLPALAADHSDETATTETVKFVAALPQEIEDARALAQRTPDEVRKDAALLDSLLHAKLQAADDLAYIRHWEAVEKQHAQEEAASHAGVVRMPPPAPAAVAAPVAPELTADELKQCEQRAIWVHLLIKEMQQQGTYPSSAVVPSPQELVPQVVAERRRLYWPWMRAQEKAKVDLKKLIEAQERAAEAAQELQ